MRDIIRKLKIGMGTSVIAASIGFMGFAIYTLVTPAKFYDINTNQILFGATLDFDERNENIIEFSNKSRIILNKGVSFPKVFKLEDGTCIQDGGIYLTNDINYFLNSENERAPIPRDLAEKLTEKNYFANRFCHLESAKKERNHMFNEAIKKHDYAIEEADKIYNSVLNSF